MSGWTTKKLGEVCETITDGDHQPPPKVASGVPFLVISDVSKGRLSFEDTRFVPEEYYAKIPEAKKPKIGDVLLTVTGSFGIPVLVDVEKRFCFQRHIALLRSNQLVPRFLVYQLSSHESFKYFDKVATGTAQRTVSLSSLRNMEIVVPPLAEQKRIVAKIDAAFEKIDRLKANAEKNLANAKELFQSALDDAMRPKKGWVEKRLGEVCSKIGSGATPRGGKASYCSKGISLIRSMNVYDCAFEYSELAHINDMQAKELANVTIEANDVLINITGASVARCCVVPSDVIPARVNQHVAILRIADARFLNPDFLCYSLVAPARKSLLLGIGEAGSTRQALTKNDLSSFMISIPDLFEQKRIVERIRALAQTTKTLQQNYARQITDCAEMRQAILREAFEGRM